MLRENEKAKIVKLVTGEELVCIIKDENQIPKSSLIRLEKPLQIKVIPKMFVSGNQEYVALVKWANFTEDNFISIPKDKVITIVNCTIDFSLKYVESLKKQDEYENRIKNAKNRNVQLQVFNDEEGEEEELDYDMDPPSKSIH